VQTLLALAAHGECVVVGRGAAQILPPETTLRVRLIAPLNYRIAAWSNRLGISLEEAARQVEATNRERISFVREHFFKDPSDLHQYDLVLNCSHFAVAGCAALVAQALQCWQAHAPAPAAQLQHS
jgi:cytidylate kinase